MDHTLCVLVTLLKTVPLGARHTNRHTDEEDKEPMNEPYDDFEENTVYHRLHGCAGTAYHGARARTHNLCPERTRLH